MGEALYGRLCCLCVFNSTFQIACIISCFVFHAYITESAHGFHTVAFRCVALPRLMINRETSFQRHLYGNRPDLQPGLALSQSLRECDRRTQPPPLITNTLSRSPSPHLYVVITPNTRSRASVTADAAWDHLLSYSFTTERRRR